jgi:MFS family permease
LADRPFLAIIGVTSLVLLSWDFFQTGVPVYVLDRLHGPPWLHGTIIALLTLTASVGGTAALRVTRRLSRTSAMSFGAALYTLWCALSLAAVIVAPGWRPAELLGATLVMAAAGLLFDTRVNALAEAAAPRAVRGRYLAAFQYAFTVPGVIAPALVSLFADAVWLPWLVVAACAGVAVFALRLLGRRLPRHVVRSAPPEYVESVPESGY